MPTRSDPNEILRFVRLRLASRRDASGVTVQLRSTTFAAALAGLPPSARAQRASEWFRDTGAGLAQRLDGDRLFAQALALIGATRAEAQPQTVRTVLSQRPGLDGTTADTRRGLAETLSDLLLASFYAPAAMPRRLEEIELAFRTIWLVDAAEQKGITRADLQRPDRHADFLDTPLRDVLSSPILLPEVWARATARKYGIGIADLLVVKQHITGYEAGEIAHIENVMATETRERNHRRLDRTEAVFTTEHEREVETESEIETAERFELSSEVARTVKEDQQLSLGVSLSATYGSVALSSDFQFQRNESREETAESATSYAKEIVERSMERVRERVRRERISRILREVEETNLHSFKNSTDQNVVGIYQFVDKVYAAQVFNYGKREMLDLMVPEPASYLWAQRDAEAAAEETQEEDLPPPQLPEKALEQIDAMYPIWTAVYRAQGIEGPPAPQITVSTSGEFPQPDPTGGGDDSADYRSTMTLKVHIPDEYKPRTLRMAAVALADSGTKHEETTLCFAVLDKLAVRDVEEHGAGDPFASYIVPYGVQQLNMSQVTIAGADVAHTNDNPDEIMLFGMEEKVVSLDGHSLPQEPAEAGSAAGSGGSLQIGVFAYSTNKYVVSVRIDCDLTASALQAWRLATLENLQTAYEARLLEHQERESKRLQAARERDRELNAEREFGTHPSRQEETILVELKKHCLAIVTEDFFTANDTAAVMTGVTSPATEFHFTRARVRGAVVRFFEQAFEWEHVQYVFYPYFWAHRDKWKSRFEEAEPVHRFRQFLQAGWARVVVPVRPGFEEALHYFFETGQVWVGEDAPPRIGDELYVSIADEIRSRTDEGVLTAVPDGTPWEVRVPTSLLHLRESNSLPHWERTDEDGDPWSWRPIPDDRQGGRPREGSPEAVPVRRNRGGRSA